MQKADVVMWEKLLIPMRNTDQNPRSASADESRSLFAVDIDRVIFSNSFRRLSRKSQVHPLALNDHIHSRLSHSLEVSCVGRSLGVKVACFLKKEGLLNNNLPVEQLGQIVQCACLAHDIGNPPFGHAGEEAIRGWFLDPANNQWLEGLKSVERSDFTCFDGNAQGFRVVNKVEMYGYDDGGMRLSLPVIASMVKYPCSSYEADSKSDGITKKYGFHYSEKELFERVFDRLGLKLKGDVAKRHPLSYLVEAADDICYSIIDLEDAWLLRLVSIDDVINIYRYVVSEEDLRRVKSRTDDRQKIESLRGLVINRMIGEACDSFIRNYDDIMSGNVRATDLLDLCHHDVLSAVKKAKDLARVRVFSEHRKTALELGAYSIYTSLLGTFIPAASMYSTKDRKKMPYRLQKALDMLGARVLSCKGKEDDSCSKYEMYMRVIDYISGMTDSYATFVAQQFSGAGTGPWQA